MAFYLKYVLLKRSQCENLTESILSHVVSFCSILFSISALTLIKMEFFNSNFTKYSRTSNIAIYEAYNI